MWEGPPPPVMLGNRIEQLSLDYQLCADKVAPCKHGFAKRIIIDSPTVSYYCESIP